MWQGRLRALWLSRRFGTTDLIPSNPDPSDRRDYEERFSTSDWVVAGGWRRIRDTVRSAMRMPSILSSLWMRGARQRGLAASISSIRRRISSSIALADRVDRLLTVAPRIGGTARAASARRCRAERRTAYRASQATGSGASSRRVYREPSRPDACAAAERPRVVAARRRSRWRPPDNHERSRTKRKLRSSSSGHLIPTLPAADSQINWSYPD